MRRYLGLVLTVICLLPSTLSAAVDIVVAPITTTNFVVGRNLASTGSGVGSLLNNWILSVPQGYPFACVALTNKGTNALGYDLLAFSSINPAVTTFIGNAFAWTGIPVQSNSFYGDGGGTNGFYVAAANTTYHLVRLTSSARYTLSFINLNSASTTIDLYGSLSNTGVCGPLDWNTIYFQDYEVNLAASTTRSILGPSSAFSYVTDASTIRYCEFTINVTAATGTLPTLNVRVQANPYVFAPSGLNDDRLSFTQITAATKRVFPFAIAGGTADHARAARTLGANSIQAGMFQSGMNFDYELGGTIPKFTFYLYGTCSR